MKPFVVTELEKDWPTTLTRWFLRSAEMTHAQSLPYTFPKLFPEKWLDKEYPEPAIAVRIAIDHHIPSILPTVFYCLSNIEVTDDWDRYHKGTDFKYGDQAAHDFNMNPIFEHRRTARWPLLDREALYLVLLGRAELNRRQRDFVGLSASDNCRGGECSKNLQKLRVSYRQSYSGSESHLGPLESLMQLQQDAENAQGICNMCTSHLTGSIEAEVKDIWTELPQIFGLHTIPGLGESSLRSLHIASDMARETSLG